LFGDMLICSLIGLLAGITIIGCSGEIASLDTTTTCIHSRILGILETSVSSVTTLVADVAEIAWFSSHFTWEWTRVLEASTKHALALSI
jgi:hypothetical protein